MRGCFYEAELTIRQRSTSQHRESTFSLLSNILYHKYILPSNSSTDAENMDSAISARSFTKFPELPVDIRLMIWESALPGPRDVGIRQCYLNTTIGEHNLPTGNLRHPAGPKLATLTQGRHQCSCIVKHPLNLPRATEQEPRILRHWTGGY